MAARTRRMVQRIDEDTERLLSKAAALTHESVPAFVVRAARDEAARVLARSAPTTMPAAQFDEVCVALDAAPRRIPALVDAAADRRTFTHG